MAEKKEPERKKLSLQGSKKLSLGPGHDLIKSSRNSQSSGMRSVQIETRRKRFSRRDNIDSQNGKINETNEMGSAKY